MTKDEQFDNSMCNDFLRTKVVDMTPAVIKQFVQDLEDELESREATPATDMKKFAVVKSGFLTELEEVCRMQAKYYKERGINFNNNRSMK